DLPSRMAAVASDLYGMNLWHFLEEMGGAAGWKIDHDNDAVRPALVLEKGEKQPSKPLTTGLPVPAKSHGPALSPPSRMQGVVLSIIGIVAAAMWLALRYGQSDVAEHLATF